MAKLSDLINITLPLLSLSALTPKYVARQAAARGDPTSKIPLIDKVKTTCFVIRRAQCSCYDISHVLVRANMTCYTHSLGVHINIAVILHWLMSFIYALHSKCTTP